MTTGLSLLTALFRKRIARETRRHLMTITTEQNQLSRHNVSALLQRLAREPEPHVHLGETESGQAVRVPLGLLAGSHGIATGGTGAGKSMAAMTVIDALLASPETE